MAVCVLANDMTKSSGCGYSLPQIVELYLANYSDVTAYTKAAPSGGSGVEITAITMRNTAESGDPVYAKFYKIEPAVNSASWSDNLGVGGSGNKYRIQTIGFTTSKPFDAEMVNNQDALSLGKYVAVAKMLDGSYIGIGFAGGLEAQADGVNTSGSGDATAESGTVVSLTGNSVESAMPLSATAIKTVIGGE